MQDFDSISVLTTSRLTEETLKQLIHKSLWELVPADKLPQVVKKIAQDVDIFYFEQIIEGYHRGLRDGYNHREMTFKAQEKRRAKWEEENKEILPTELDSAAESDI